MPAKTLAITLLAQLDPCTGLTEIWSNGQTEGQVHRLKLLKRQMYGRAGFDVLRPRVMRAA